MSKDICPSVKFCIALYLAAFSLAASRFFLLSGFSGGPVAIILLLFPNVSLSSELSSEDGSPNGSSASAFFLASSASAFF